ncbi:dihydrofolate reductase [Solihabitans fulvus]|uniref:Dihydrofolate reductase n=1 Tax=Solihabitans fulvus TaxID=1892852 RepID=A0A5B2WX45_9PSEU|nr:dihydrofolate reductase family protein [Solihabitans fulvus]KAA2255450.1 dihydrofolate reductase [Solihabitans fulvus]
MRTLTYYIAATIDGYIADQQGGFDFFLPFEGEVAAAILADWPETMPVHARGPLGLTDVPNARFDAVLMGRGTYEPALAAGITSPYSHLRQYVFSRTIDQLDPEVEIVSGDPLEFVRELKRQEGMGIWLCGGGRLAGALLTEIDELVIKRHPIVAGTGIPLFDGPFDPTGFTRAADRTFDSGVTFETYTRN